MARHGRLPGASRRRAFLNVPSQESSYRRLIWLVTPPPGATQLPPRLRGRAFPARGPSRSCAVLAGPPTERLLDLRWSPRGRTPPPRFPHRRLSPATSPPPDRGGLTDARQHTPDAPRD